MESNREPRFNDEEDMALIDCILISGNCTTTYLATFHKVGQEWKLRGVRATMTAINAGPPDREIFIGVWHGFDEDRSMFGRLKLKKDGTGWFALSAGRDLVPDIYRVKLWSPRKHDLDINLEPIGPSAEPITLRNVANWSDSLDLEVHGKVWSRKMSLFNESEFRGRAGAVKRSLESLRKTK